MVTMASTAAMATYVIVSGPPVGLMAAEGVVVGVVVGALVGGSVGVGVAVWIGAEAATTPMADSACEGQ